MMEMVSATLDMRTQSFLGTINFTIANLIRRNWRQEKMPSKDCLKF